MNIETTFTCNICNKSFCTYAAKNAHMAVHKGGRDERVNQMRKISQNVGIQKLQINEQNYFNNPSFCLECKKLLSYSLRHNKFCSSSCAATFNNKNRKPKFIKCERCGTEWKVGSKKKKLKWCDNCKQQQHYGLVDWTCPICNKILQLKSSVAKKRKFCSGACRNKINNLKLIGSRSKAEQILEDKLKNIFPNLTIICNDRKILNGLELDFYIPEIKNSY